MNDSASLTPPSASDRPVDASPDDVGPVRRIPSPVGLFAAAVAVASAFAGVVGTAVGLLVASSSASSCSPSDGWCGLGAALAGILMGLATATVVYIVAGVVTIRRCRPVGERAAHIAAHIAFPFATFVLLSMLHLLTATQ